MRPGLSVPERIAGPTRYALVIAQERMGDRAMHLIALHFGVRLFLFGVVLAFVFMGTVHHD